MGEPSFKLNSSSMAILEENGVPSVVTVPANAVVTVVDGDATANRFVKIRYHRIRF
jgi:hypothetical protein